MSHHLINFYIPYAIKVQLDAIAKAKRLSRTAIINQLLEMYCRQEGQGLVQRAMFPATHQIEDDLPLVPFLADRDYFEEGWRL